VLCRVGPPGAGWVRCSRLLLLLLLLMLLLVVAFLLAIAVLVASTVNVVVG